MLLRTEGEDDLWPVWVSPQQSRKVVVGPEGDQLGRLVWVGVA